MMVTLENQTADFKLWTKESHREFLSIQAVYKENLICCLIPITGGPQMSQLPAKSEGKKSGE